MGLFDWFRKKDDSSIDCGYFPHPTKLPCPPPPPPKKTYFEEHLLKYEETTETNGSFIMKYVDKTDDKENKNGETLVNVVNYINGLKWLMDRNFLLEISDYKDYEDFTNHLYINFPLRGTVLFKTPWSEVPISFKICVVPQIAYEKSFKEAVRNPVMKWRASTYLTWLFDNAAKRDDLKDSPLCNQEIYRMFSDTDKHGSTVTYSKIMSEWHDMPQQSIMFIFNKLDELLPKIGNLSDYQHQLEEAQSQKENALKDIGVEELNDGYRHEHGWSEKPNESNGNQGAEQ